MLPRPQYPSPLLSSVPILNSHSDSDSDTDLVTGKRFAVQAKWESNILEGSPYPFPLVCFVVFCISHRRKNHFFPLETLNNERRCQHMQKIKTKFY